jgi:peptidoglycan/LPS O-acetylase OafA/YrhL
LYAHLDELRRPSPPAAPQAHLSGRHLPRTAEQQRRSRFLRVWAAVSTPLLLASVPVILLARPLAWGTTLVALALLFGGFEAFARRRLLSFVASTALLLGTAAACVAIVVLSQQYWALAISVAFALAALMLLLGNVGDLAHGWRRGGPLEAQTEERSAAELADGSP